MTQTQNTDKPLAAMEKKVSEAQHAAGDQPGTGPAPKPAEPQQGDKPAKG